MNDDIITKGERREKKKRRKMGVSGRSTLTVLVPAIRTRLARVSKKARGNAPTES